MHNALHALVTAAPGRTRSATLIRRRMTRRHRWSSTAKVLAASAVLACAGVIVVSIVAAGRPISVLDLVTRVPGAAFAASAAPDDGSAPLSVRTEPAGARVVLDGRERGRTPLELHTSTGEHVLFLDSDRSIDAAATVNVAAAGTTLDMALWTRRPVATHLRSAYPGVQLVDAAFLSDGTVQLIDALHDNQPGQPARSTREAWLVESGTGSDRGPSQGAVGLRAAAVAVSPDDRRLATLQDASRVQLNAPTVRVGTSRLDSVWVGRSSTRSDPGTAVYRLQPVSQTMVGILAQEEIVGLTWLPDSRHLLVASRFGDPAAGGPVRTRLLVVDAGADGNEQLDPEPTELIVLPAEVLLTSVVWSPDAHRVGVVLRAAAAPGAKRVVGLGVLDVGRSSASSLQYVADLGPDDSPAGRVPVAPVAWEPCDAPDRCAVGGRLAYTAPAPNTSSPGAGPLGLLAFLRPPSTTPAAVFVSTLDARTLTVGEALRLGGTSGIIGPAWRSPGVGVPGATLVGFARGAGNALALRAIDPTTGGVQDTGVQLPPDVAASASSVGVRWDVRHARALVLARSSDRGLAGGDAVDVWLVDFRGAPGARQ